MNSITITKRAENDYIAWLDGTGRWGCGDSIESAVGDLVMSHDERFELVVNLPGKEKVS